MKRKIAMLIVRAMIFTSSFGMNAAYASADSNESLDLFMEFIPDDDGAVYYSEELYLEGVAVDGQFTYIIKVIVSNYNGTKTVYFKINPKAASNVKLTKGKNESRHCLLSDFCAFLHSGLLHFLTYESSSCINASSLLCELLM